MVKKIFVLSAFALMSLVSCNGGGGGGGGESTAGIRLSKMNLTGAKAIFLGTANTSNDVTNKLFKVTEDGYVEEVTYTWVDEETGEETSKTVTIQPKYVRKLNKDYVFVCFHDYPQADTDEDNYNYLVNINTNECFKYSKSLPNKYYLEGDRAYNECFPEDTLDNIYVLSNDYDVSYNIIKKISIMDPTHIVVNNLSMTNDDVSYTYSFASDKYGNIAYQCEDASGNTTLRYISALTKQWYNIPCSLPRETDFWQGYDGEIYFNDYYDIEKLSFDNTKVTAQKVDSYAELCHAASAGWNRKRFYIKKYNKIILVDPDPGAGDLEGGLYEVYNDTHTHKYVSKKTELGLNTIKLSASSSNYIYLSGIDTNMDNVLLRVNPSDYSVEKYEVSNYDIYNFTVDDNELITFNALRKDGAIVVGTLNNGTVKESEVTFNKKVEFLEHL